MAPGNTQGSWITDFLKTKEEGLKIKPNMSSMRNPFLNAMIIKEDTSPFENLGTIKTFAKDIPADIPEDAIAADTFPIPATKDREHYHGDQHASWWVSGRSDLLGMQMAAARLNIDFERMRYYEMGCASGRVVRHVACATRADVWCSDINLRHVEWVQRFLGNRIKAFNSTAFPSLPLESNAFDVVSAFSVFTHIDDLEVSWLLELRRILRPGGMAYISLCTDDTWAQYKQGWIKDNLMPIAASITDYQVNDALFRGGLPCEKSVFWWPVREIYNSMVFHSKDYIRRVYGMCFEVVDIIRNGHTYQDVVVLRKPNSP